MATQDLQQVQSGDLITADLMNALLSSDYAPVQAFVLLMATIFVLVNVGIDILYGIADPRISVE